MFLYFCTIIFILGVISPFVRHIQIVTCSVFAKKRSKKQQLAKFQRDIFPLLYCMAIEVVFGDFIYI